MYPYRCNFFFIIKTQNPPLNYLQSNIDLLYIFIYLYYNTRTSGTGTRVSTFLYLDYLLASREMNRKLPVAMLECNYDLNPRFQPCLLTKSIHCLSIWVTALCAVSLHTQCCSRTRVFCRLNRFFQGVPLRCVSCQMIRKRT